jgi:hypothetical protein
MYQKDRLISLLISRHDLTKEEAEQALKLAARNNTLGMPLLDEYAVMGLTSEQAAQRIWIHWMAEVFSKKLPNKEPTPNVV